MKRDIRDICTRPAYSDVCGVRRDKNVDILDEDTRLDSKRALSFAKQTSSWTRKGGYTCNYKYIFRYVEKSVGRYWNDVFSEFCKTVDDRSAAGFRAKDAIRGELASESPCHVSKETGNLVDSYGKIVVAGTSRYLRKHFYVDSEGILREFVPKKDTSPSPYYTYTPEKQKVTPNVKIKNNQYLVKSGWNFYVVDTLDVSKVSSKELFSKLLAYGDVMLNERFSGGYPEYYKVNPGLLEKDLRALYAGDLVLGYSKRPAPQSLLNEQWKQNDKNTP